MSQSGEAAYEMSSMATSGNSVLSLFSSSLGKEVKREGGVAFRELGGPSTERSFITQAFSWVLGLLIKDIISQQNQPRSQHDWECLINTKEKHCARAKSLKTATSITASELALHSPEMLFFTVWWSNPLWLF